MKALKEFFTNLFMFLFVVAIVLLVVAAVYWYAAASETADVNCLVRCKASIDFMCVWRCQ